MGIHLPIEHAVAHVRGAAVATAIPAGGIKATSALLAVIQHDAGGTNPAGLDPAAFAVSAGEVESATLDTSGKYLALIYTKG